MESRYQEALSAFQSGNPERTRDLADPIIQSAPDSPEGLALRLLRARAYEFGGYPGGVQLQRAYEDYHDLQERSADLAGSEALLGAARVLFDIDRQNNKAEIERLCRAAIAEDGSAHAHMLLGLLNEKVHNEHGTARRHYMAAFAKGLPWGARYAALSHGADGNRLRSVALHTLATVCSPLLVLLKGARGPFS